MGFFFKGERVYFVIFDCCIIYTFAFISPFLANAFNATDITQDFSSQAVVHTRTHGSSGVLPCQEAYAHARVYGGPY